MPVRSCLSIGFFQICGEFVSSISCLVAASKGKNRKPVQLLEKRSFVDNKDNARIWYENGNCANRSEKGRDHCSKARLFANVELPIDTRSRMGNHQLGRRSACRNSVSGKKAYVNYVLCMMKRRQYAHAF